MNIIEQGVLEGFISFDEDLNFITYNHQNKKRNYKNPEEKVRAEIFLTLILIYGYSEKRIKQFVSVQMVEHNQILVIQIFRIFLS